MTGTSDHLHDIEIEQALLGAFFLKAAMVAETASLVSPDDFFEPLHGKIHAAMIRLAEEGRAVTPDTVGPLFLHEPPIGTLSVRQYFGRLAAATPSLLTVPDYAKIVRDFAMRRKLFEAGTLAQQLAGDMDRHVGDAAVEAIGGIDGIVSGSRAARQTRVIAVDAAMKFMDELESGTGLPPVPTGLVDVDAFIGGLWRGDYHIMAGRPSMGKTTGGSAFATNAARKGCGVLFLSLEMRTDAVIARILSDLVFNSQTPIPYRDILRHKANRNKPVLNEHDIWRLREALNIFHDLPLVIDDKSSMTVSEIVTKARREAAKFEERGFELQLIVIDHKDFIKASSRYSGNKVAETGEVSAALKDAFKELNVAGLLLCQLSRDVEKRTNRRPDLPDLRWAGDLEQDADMVLFPYREAYYLEGSRLDDPNEEAARLIELDACARNLELIIAKQRNGPRGTVDLWADMANNAIRNKLR